MTYNEIIEELNVKELAFNPVPGHFIFSKGTLYAICNRNIIFIDREVYVCRSESQMTLVLEEKYPNNTRLFSIKMDKEDIQ